MGSAWVGPGPCSRWRNPSPWPGSPAPAGQDGQQCLAFFGPQFHVYPDLQNAHSSHPGAAPPWISSSEGVSGSHWNDLGDGAPSSPFPFLHSACRADIPCISHECTAGLPPPEEQIPLLRGPCRVPEPRGILAHSLDKWIETLASLTVPPCLWLAKQLPLSFWMTPHTRV